MRFLHFMGEGGWGMWFVLIFGLITVAAAIGFALQPRPEGEHAVRSFSRATTFSILSTVCLDLAAVGSRVPNEPAFALIRIPCVPVARLTPAVAELFA